MLVNRGSIQARNAVCPLSSVRERERERERQLER